ncbi:putative ribonuclease H-like domain-containing protein [Tanacetum coccineum]
MNGDERYKSRDNTRRIVPVETSDALVVKDIAFDCLRWLGYDWILTRSGRIPVSTAKQTKMTDLNNGSKDNNGSWISKRGNPQQALKYKGMFDSVCSRHMTGNKALLTDYILMEVWLPLVKELEVKNNVLFTKTEYLVLSPDFKLIDESQVLLRVPRQNNMYSFDLKNVVPSRDLTCLFAKAIIDESKLWHKRLGHVDFKTMNKLVKGNLVRGLPLKTFENDHTCVACQKGNQHKASCKTKHVSSISQPFTSTKSGIGHTKNV